MKVLVVHNYYRSDQPSGENRVVSLELELLKGAGFDVQIYSRNSDEIAGFGIARRAELGIRPIFSLEDARAFRQAVQRFCPDVIHLHNPFPLISPWVVREAVRAEVPIVQTVHNYRHVCVEATLFRNDRQCRDCIGHRVPWPAVAHGCYRGSIAQSAVMAAAQTMYRTTWQKVDRFLPVSTAVALRLAEAGISKAKITVRPATVADHGQVSLGGKGVLFAGRLASLKGICLLLEAWIESGVGPDLPLAIAGDGPERPVVEKAAHDYQDIAFLGPIAAEEMRAALRSASVVAVPSLWEDPCPLSAIEALSCGRPIIATQVGGLSDIVDASVGWVVDRTVSSVAAALREAAYGTDSDAKAAEARNRYESRYAAPVALASLTRAYEDAVRSASTSRAS